MMTAIYNVLLRGFANVFRLAEEEGVKSNTVDVSVQSTMDELVTRMQDVGDRNVPTNISPQTEALHAVARAWQKKFMNVEYSKISRQENRVALGMAGEAMRMPLSALPASAFAEYTPNLD